LCLCGRVVYVPFVRWNHFKRPGGTLTAPVAVEWGTYLLFACSARRPREAAGVPVTPGSLGVSYVDLRCAGEAIAAKDIQGRSMPLKYRTVGRFFRRKFPFSVNALHRACTACVGICTL